MLARLKFKIEALVSEMLDQLPSDVWVNANTTFLDPAMGGGQFLEQTVKRLRDHGHCDNNIRSRVFGVEANIGRVNFVGMKNLPVQMAVGNFDLDYAEAFGVKQFDVIVGNPPYNRGILSETHSSKIARGNASIAFIERAIELINNNGFIAFVLPTNLMTLPSLHHARLFILNHVFVEKLIIKDNVKHKHFPIDNDNIMIMLMHRDTNQCAKYTTFVRDNFLTGTIGIVQDQLNKYSYWPMHLGNIEKSIFEKVVAKRTKDLNFNSGKYFISAPIMGDNNSRNHTKFWCFNYKKPSVKHSTEFFWDDGDHATLYYAFTQTKLFNLLLNIVKSTPKNQPSVISYIGDYDFVSDNFYQFFNLSREEICYLETVMKT